MLKVVRAADRHHSDFGWLKTHWLFSFSTHYDPDNLCFGPLKAFNDDTVEPGEGFPLHPHRDMEVVTIVLSGQMTHQDSLGNKSVIAAGEVHRMSAGIGLNHSELNLGDGPAHYYQLWLEPSVRGLKPGYEQKAFKPYYYFNRLLPVASGGRLPDAVKLSADATIFMADIDEGFRLSHKTAQKRRTFVYVTEGDVEVNEVKLRAHDQARIDAESEVNFKARKPTKLIAVDLPTDYGFGYDRKTLKGRRGY